MYSIFLTKAQMKPKHIINASGIKRLRSWSYIKYKFVLNEMNNEYMNDNIP